MKVAIIGVGGIGSTFAFMLSQHGHQVTVIARGNRLQELKNAGNAIVCKDGKRAPVTVMDKLDEKEEWDLVLVITLVADVDALLPTLAACNARKIMFMFNMFSSLDRLQQAVGMERFAFGFPAILAGIIDGKLNFSIVSGAGWGCLSTDVVWAKIFTEAKIPTIVEVNMESWLKTHAALVAPVMCIMYTCTVRHGGATWTESMETAKAMDEGFDLVRRTGHEVIPTSMWVISRAPAVAKAMLVWCMTRMSFIRDNGSARPREPKALIEEMRQTAMTLGLTLPNLVRMSP